MTMVSMAARDRRLRRARANRRTLTELARQFDISRTRVVQILEATGGDPLASAQTSQLRASTIAQLESETGRLRARIASDRRRLRAVQDELSARQTDRILGFAD